MPATQQAIALLRTQLLTPTHPHRSACASGFVFRRLPLNPLVERIVCSPPPHIRSFIACLPTRRQAVAAGASCRLWCCLTVRWLARRHLRVRPRPSATAEGQLRGPRAHFASPADEGYC
eukprot:scaffold186636_cov25-Tisochrysis_lutea.AAC.3